MRIRSSLPEVATVHIFGGGAGEAYAFPQAERRLGKEDQRAGSGHMRIMRR
jgi:hypothetical protein